MSFFASKKMAPPADGGGSSDSEDEYLNRLAKSILSKPKAPPPGRPVPNSSGEFPRPKTSASSFGDPLASERETRAPLPSPQRPVTKFPSGDLHPRTPLPHGPTSQSHSHSHSHADAHAHDWVRTVDFFDDKGRFIPGTILVFEDGSMGIYRSFNADKDYDIVYQLQGDGKAKPHGMPLYAYEVEPVGRVSHACVDQIVKSGTWERDMIVFHLLKYKDRIHIPTIASSPAPTSSPEPVTAVAPATEEPSSWNTDTVSNWVVEKLPASQVSAEMPPPGPQDNTPALLRGRHFSLSFGGNQRWHAVYWGKDELGHVVVHNTHDKWSLMHLDLNRFKDSMVIGEMASQDEIKRMEKDFSHH